MKITLEFEEADLRKMITDHFTNEGFNVKNLDEICQKFALTYPEGLKVEADIAPLPPPITTVPSGYRAVVPTEAVATDNGEDELHIVPAEVEPEDVRLNIGDLLDPTPRLGRTELTRKKGTKAPEDVEVSSIEKLVRQSRTLEKNA